MRVFTALLCFFSSSLSFLFCPSLQTSYGGDEYYTYADFSPAYLPRPPSKIRTRVKDKSLDSTCRRTASGSLLRGGSSSGGRDFAYADSPAMAGVFGDGYREFSEQKMAYDGSSESEDSDGMSEVDAEQSTSQGTGY